MSRKDLSGYYAALGLDQSAASDQIKKAFKAKAQEFHPDRNSAPEATRQFQFINEAYHVLGDPQARAKYDAHSYEPPMDDAAPPAHAVDPVVCSVCQRVTAQPRYAIYRQVISAMFITWRTVNQGIFCSECGAKNAYRASLKTWLLGWWGFPWGPIYSIQAIIWNMRGGEQPPLNNLRILSWQAIYFSQMGRSGLARAVARDALTFGNKIPESEKLYDSQTKKLIADVEIIVAGGSPNDRAPVLRDLWGFRSKAFKVQLGTVGVLAALIGAIVLFTGGINQTPAYKHVPPTEAVVPTPTIGFRPVPTKSTTPALTQSPVAQATNADTLMTAPQAFNEPVVSLPATGRIRALWRSNPEILLASLKVVTATGSPNYYVKVVDWETHAASLIFFVRSGETTTVRLPLGVYELRYAAGEKWYGEEYLFGPNTAYAKADESFNFRAEGEKISGFTVELIKQINGNLSETRIRASDF
jgi:hypothetical protein